MIEVGIKIKVISSSGCALPDDWQGKIIEVTSYSPMKHFPELKGFQVEHEDFVVSDWMVEEGSLEVIYEEQLELPLEGGK